MIQYRTAQVINEAIKGTSHDLPYQETGLEFLADRKQSCKIFFFYNIVNWLLPSYHQPYLNHCNNGEYQIRAACQNKLQTVSGRTKTFNSSFIYALLRNDMHLVKKLETLSLVLQAIIYY